MTGEAPGAPGSHCGGPGVAHWPTDGCHRGLYAAPSHTTLVTRGAVTSHQSPDTSHQSLSSSVLLLGQLLASLPWPEINWRVAVPAWSGRPLQRCLYWAARRGGPSDQRREARSGPSWGCSQLGGAGPYLSHYRWRRPPNWQGTNCHTLWSL